MEVVLDANVLLAGFLRAAVMRELLLDERLTLRIKQRAGGSRGLGRWKWHRGSLPASD